MNLFVFSRPLSLSHSGSLRMCVCGCVVLHWQRCSHCLSNSWVQLKLEYFLLKAKLNGKTRLQTNRKRNETGTRTRNMKSFRTVRKLWFNWMQNSTFATGLVCICVYVYRNRVLVDDIFPTFFGMDCVVVFFYFLFLSLYLVQRILSTAQTHWRLDEMRTHSHTNAIVLSHSRQQ